jgi:hypothetical protein
VKHPEEIFRVGSPADHDAEIVMTRSQSGKVCVTDVSSLFLRSATPSMAAGLGRWRWVVERTFAWLNQFRRLHVRYEKRADIHEAFLSLGCAVICWRFLRVDWVAGWGLRVEVIFARNALTCLSLAL